MSGRPLPDSSQSGRSSDDASSPRSVLGKMILPRLDAPLYEVSAMPKRTAHACERCRALKAKCTGGLRCEKCVLDKAECKYGDGKRERNKKEMASQLQKSTSLIIQNEQLLAAVREVSADPNFDAEKHPAVVQLLSKYPLGDSSDNLGLANAGGRRRKITPIDEGETVTAASVGSPGAMDRLVPLVSLGIGSGASGYVGKSSEISWLQRAQEQMSPQQGDDDVATESDENHPHGSKLDYHMDEANLLAVDEDSVNPMDMPPLPIAKILAHSYFETVHDSFPLVAKGVFMDALLNQFHNRPPSSWEGRHWLSMANIIFAVGAKWLYLTRPRGADMQGLKIGPGDHVVYYARARSLGLDHRLIMDHPLIEQIQALGILGLYLIVNHQISRAWTTVGHAIRHAVALGLHLRVGAGIDFSQQQLRSRTWWSLYGLEQLLGDFTGRPTSILDSDIAIPLDLTDESESAPRPAQAFPSSTAPQEAFPDRLPLALSGVQYPPGLYFVCRIRLSIIGHKIRSSLYAPGKMKEAWSTLQQNIRDFDRELTQWSADLPEEMGLQPGIDIRSSNRQDGQLLDHFELAMAYQSTRMILFRPCLCHLEGLIPQGSALSHSFNQEAAISCVSAARTLLALLPNEAASSHASKMLPWWSLLHYITQAGAVLVLELCLKAEHLPSQVKELLGDLAKVMAWLAEMAGDSLSAWRSWKIFRKLSLQAAAGVGIDLIIPEDVHKPPGWKPAYEQLLSQTLKVPFNHQADPQMLNHLRQQAEMPLVSAANGLFPVGGGLLSDSWHLLSPLRDSTTDLARCKRHAHARPTDELAGGMDWST